MSVQNIITNSSDSSDSSDSSNTSNKTPFKNILEYDEHIFKFISDSGIDINTIDPSILSELYPQFVNTTDIQTHTTNTADIQTHTTNKLLCDAAYEMAMTNIPEMFCPTGMIILNGYINNKSLKILLDTGASTSIIFDSVVKRLELSELVDHRVKTELHGIGTETSSGKIWYTELQLNNIYFPISLTVSNNTIEKFDMILGINFLQSYNAQIDFKNKKIKLNDKYDIVFLYEN